MVNFELSGEEAKLTLNVLENYLLHLEVEINRTHRREFRDASRKEKRLCKR